MPGETISGPYREKPIYSQTTQYAANYWRTQKTHKQYSDARQHCCTSHTMQLSTNRIDDETQHRMEKTNNLQRDLRKLGSYTMQQKTHSKAMQRNTISDSSQYHLRAKWRNINTDSINSICIHIQTNPLQNIQSTTTQQSLMAVQTVTRQYNAHPVQH